MMNSEPELINLKKFVKLLSSPGIIRMIQVLNGKTMRYHDIFSYFEKYGTSKGNTAYYLRRLMTTGVVAKDRSGFYYLTFRGIKLAELADTLIKISNLSMSTPDDAMTQIIIKLNKNEHWLKPLIKKEIRDAVAELTNKGDIKN